MKPKFSTLNDFAKGFITCALWLCDESPGSGEWGKVHDFYQRLTAKSVKRALDLCAKFQQDNAELLAAYCAQIPPVADYSADERAGHDLFLTSAGHGAGFWDRDEVAEDIRDALSDAARKIGETYVTRYKGRIYMQ